MPNITDGFTLIELLIVIAIIGILVAMLIPEVLQAHAKANDGAALAYLRQCVTSMESVRDDLTGRFMITPATCEDPVLGNAKLSLPPAVKNSTVTLSNSEEYTISVISSSGRIFSHNGNTIIKLH